MEGDGSIEWWGRAVGSILYQSNTASLYDCASSSVSFTVDGAMEIHASALLLWWRLQISVGESLYAAADKASPSY